MRKERSAACQFPGKTCECVADAPRENKLSHVPLMRALLPYICLVIAFTLLGCGGTSEPTDAGTLAQCYATEFGAKPPPGVKDLRAKQVVVRDAASAWLRFVADSNIVAQIVSNRFTPSDMGTFLDRSGGANTPAWWRPNEDSLTTFLICEKWVKGENYSMAVLAYDEAQQVVYFCHGISF